MKPLNIKSVQIFFGYTVFLVAIAITWILIELSGMLGDQNSIYRGAVTEYLNRETLIAAPFNKQKLAQFRSKKSRVILIGDSYAKDVFNSIRNSPLNDRYEIATFAIGKECGNLFIDKQVLKNHVPRSRWLRCQITGWYDDPKLISTIHDSQEIWLASSWSFWVARNLNDSISNLKRKFSKPVIVFGPKSFGFNSIEEKLLDIKLGNFSASAKPNEHDLDINDYMKNNVFADKYVNLFEIFCSAQLDKCKHFQGNKLISHDGAHLTIHGTEFLGRKLSHLWSAID